MGNHIDPNSQTFNLPQCLRVPIAASDIDSVEKYVGKVIKTVIGRDKTVKAMLIKPHVIGEPENSQAKLWQHEDRESFIERLYPEHQVWVHVDYWGYRKAYIGFGMPEIPKNYVLDHIQNRKAIRGFNMSHPYLRLCPVSRSVNASGGHRLGSEGMERDNMKLSKSSHEKWIKMSNHLSSYQIIYADPVDLTKMLNIPPGTHELPGVAKMLNLYYVDKKR